MCGIAGFIGNSIDSKLSYQLASALFAQSELRGTDASGVWGTESGKNGRVLYHKNSMRSSEFVKTDFWKNIKELDIDTLLLHARFATKGVQHAHCNTNNHPFVSEDRRIGMIHNGHLDEAELLQGNYEVESSTDSEYLLRIFEQGLEEDGLKIEGIPQEIANRMTGISKIWSVISTGAMAVAFGERLPDGNRHLCLFRNERRPLWVADLRKLLGQIFFFSTPEIWYRALESNSDFDNVDWKSCKLIELPTKQVWFFQTNQNQIELHKMKIKVTDKVQKWNRKLCKIQSSKENLSIIP